MHFAPAEIRRAQAGTSPFSLGRHLLSRVLLVVVPIVVAGMAVHWWFQSRLLERQFDDALVEKAMTLATLVVHEGGKMRLEFADEFMPQYSREERPYFFQIRHPDGRSFERSYSLHGQDLPFQHGPLSAPAAFDARLDSGVSVRCVGIEFPTRLSSEPSAEPASSVVIVLGTESLQLEETLRQGYREIAITGLVTLAGIAGFVLLVVRRGLLLLRRVVREVEDIVPGSRQKPIDPAHVPEEIRPIVGSLNESMRLIQGHAERERRFTADVAHELRTPIAELRMAADLALKWPDEESRERLARNAQAIALQMGALVEVLLELATLEAAGAGGPVETIDLSGLVARGVEQAERAHDGSREIELDLPDSLPLATQAQLWEVVVRNLVDNALCHSPPHGRVVVRLAADGDGARLVVSNPSGSLDPADLARCTERLWRANPHEADGKHFGLGLSLVQAACAKLGHPLTVHLDRGMFHATVQRTRPPGGSGT